jgi:uncharacterized protein (TIGR02271 family)
MTTLQDAQQFMGLTAVDIEGSKLGKIDQIYLDEQTGEPVWITIVTGMLGTRQNFAPIYGSEFEGDQVRLAVSKDLVKDAPKIDDDGHIGESEQEALYRHYAGYLGNSQTGAEAGYTDGSDLADNSAGVRGRDTSGPTTDTAMTRSEERLHVGTENVQTGRARLRKYVVTETVTTSVPVSHEEVRLEREPITEANRDAALSGPAISEEEHEMTLHAERPMVAKEAVPVERVRLGTETVTQEQQITEQVRKEQIDEPDVEAGPQDTSR